MLERPWLWTRRRRRRRVRSRLAGSCSSNLRLNFRLGKEGVFLHGTSLRFSLMSFDSDQGEIKVETDIGGKRAVWTVEAKTYLRPRNSIQAKWRVKF